jgi:hypothetical protein
MPYVSSQQFLTDFPSLSYHNYSTDSCVRSMSPTRLVRAYLSSSWVRSDGIYLIRSAFSSVAPSLSSLASPLGLDVVVIAQSFSSRHSF